ncbi:Na+/solute symporter [Violaceomyces palustris]|uniref:Na+/solute symporter n=1 Tax=Violaceomyces palustris TaxID=1673888 RepID=A0ACD0P4Z1_9BASI|nr:Na+/solute symporter [Violaceomyces palustris]
MSSEGQVATARVLSQGVGWGVVCGLGFVFALFIILLSAIQNRYTKLSLSSTDEFASASRSVKPGLVAAGICSAWTWSSTLLQSSAVTYNVGVAGGYWYAAGATIQILLCSIMACKIKLNAPFCSTYLEVLRVRWGKLLHIPFICFALATNLLVSAQLVLGGSAVVNDLTGVPIYAAVWLIPFGVAGYVCVGGMRATLLADYSHTVGLLVIILWFFFQVYCTSPKLGSLEKMVELLTDTPVVEGNAGGSYLTFRSTNGVVFGIINIVGGLATVFADQSYHQRSIASNPATAARAFLLGGSAWFAIPFLFSMTMGLAARALVGKDPAMPNLTAADVTAGLAAPSAAVAIAGTGGAVAILILLFLAVTSASSAQQVAVSSVLTFDVYKPYFRPNASKKEIYWVTHIMVLVWASVMAIFGCIFNAAGVRLGWIYLMMGIIIAPAVAPVFCGLVWSKTNRIGCLCGMLIGLSTGILTWLIVAWKLYGPLTVESTGRDYPTLAGNVVSLLVSAIITVVSTLVSPEKEDHFSRTRAINAPEDVAERSRANTRPGSLTLATPSIDEKKESGSLDPDSETHIDYVRAAGLDPVELNKTLRMTSWISVSASLVLVILIPACVSSRRIWDPKGLGAWVWLGFVWLLWTAFSVGILPIYESRHELVAILRGIGRDLTGKGGKVNKEEEEEQEK